jgi:hypothetical protein
MSKSVQRTAPPDVLKFGRDNVAFSSICAQAGERTHMRLYALCADGNSD